jgi:hypothetical protein
VGPRGITNRASEAPAGAKRPDVGREDREAAAAATAFFNDNIFGVRIGWELDVADGTRDLAVMLVVERGSVDGALRIPAPIPVPLGYVRGANIFGTYRAGVVVAAAVATDTRVPGGDVGFEGDPRAEDG